MLTGSAGEPIRVAQLEDAGRAHHTIGYDIEIVLRTDIGSIGST